MLIRTRPTDIAVSAFFSLHRPISITSSIPGLAGPQVFEDIFRSASKPVRSSSDVIDTISSAVETLEDGQQRRPSSHRSYEDVTNDEFRTAITSVSEASEGDHHGGQAVRHVDGDAASAMSVLAKQLMAGRYLPFQPPPAPLTWEESSSSWSSSVAESSSSTTTTEPPSETLRRAYSTVLTILESTHPNGSKTFTAQASRIVSRDLGKAHSDPDHPSVSSSSSSSSSPPALTFLQRRRLGQSRQLVHGHHHHQDDQFLSQRQGRGEGGSLDQIWWGLSVKRQRKLKMKKHKYKKLMRRTRNLRRRLDRA